VIESLRGDPAGECRGLLTDFPPEIPHKVVHVDAVNAALQNPGAGGEIARYGEGHRSLDSWIDR